jgi:hypothetical protein
MKVKIIRNIDNLLNDSASGIQFVKACKFAYPDLTPQQAIDDINEFQNHTMISNHERIIIVQALAILDRELAIQQRLEK